MNLFDFGVICVFEQILVVEFDWYRDFDFGVNFPNPIAFIQARTGIGKMDLVT